MKFCKNNNNTRHEFLIKGKKGKEKSAAHEKFNAAISDWCSQHTVFYEQSNVLLPTAVQFIHSSDFICWNIDMSESDDFRRGVLCVEI